MRKIIYEGKTHEPLVRLFAPGPFTTPHHCMWVEHDGVCQGGFAWTAYSGRSIQMHYAGRNPWLSRRFLRRAFTYCFDDLGVEVILALIEPEKIHARDVAIEIGFEQLCVVPRLGIHMLSMVREQCRWLVSSRSPK